MKRKTLDIPITPNCPNCHTPLSLFDNELPCGAIWYCDQHLSDGIEAVFMTLRDVDAVLRDPDVWLAIVDEHQEYEARNE